MTLLIYKQILMPIDRSCDISWSDIDENIHSYFYNFIKKNTRFLGYADCTLYVKVISKKVDNLFVVYTDRIGNLRVESKIEKRQLNYVFSSKAFPRSDDWLNDMIGKVQQLYRYLFENSDQIEMTMHCRISGHKMFSMSSDYVHLSLNNMGEGMRKQYQTLKIDMKKFTFSKPLVNIYFAKAKPTLLCGFSQTVI